MPDQNKTTQDFALADEKNSKVTPDVKSKQATDSHDYKKAKTTETSGNPDKNDPSDTMKEAKEAVDSGAAATPGQASG